jgi:hypothetical protein
LSAKQAKQLVLARIATGATVNEAIKTVGRAEETYRDWRRTDPQFKADLFHIRDRLAAGLVSRSDVPDFPTFCERFLKPLPLHHLRVWDVLNGERPRSFHDSMTYIPGSRDPGDSTKAVIVNLPPDHAKSTVWTFEYVVWSIVRNPDIRIAVISKTQGMAKKFLSQVKFVLGNASLFPELHAAYAPKGGWRSDEHADGLQWTQNLIYVKGREQAEKDPTVEALGIGGHIFGSRFDKLILDDVEDFSTAGLWEQHGALIGQDIYTRLDKDHGELFVLGTRVGVMDIYRHLRDEAKTEDDLPFYTYFSQPAILENETQHSSEWKVLWPERMPARSIAKAKSAMTDQRRFAFVYQQLDVPDDATFPAGCVDAAINRQRFYGPMTAGAPGHRQEGMQGLYVVGAWDPASSAGRNAFVVAGTDKRSQHRWVMDVWTKKGAVPRETIQLLKDWTIKYHINEWRIEKNAVQSFITQLPEIRDFLSGHGCRLVEHQTYGNKWDPNLGVEGCLVPLFLSCAQDIGGKLVPVPDGKGRISLPSPRHRVHVNDMCEQLKRWEPNNKRIVQDLVMAMWFAELGLKAYLRGGSAELSHIRSPFLTRGALKARGVVSIEDIVSYAA